MSEWSEFMIKKILKTVKQMVYMHIHTYIRMCIYAFGFFYDVCITVIRIHRYMHNFSSSIFSVYKNTSKDSFLWTCSIIRC